MSKYIKNFINLDLFQRFKYTSILYLLVSSLYASPTQTQMSSVIYRLVLSAHSAVLGVGYSAVYFSRETCLKYKWISELVIIPRLSPLKIVTTVVLTENK